MRRRRTGGIILGVAVCTVLSGCLATTPSGSGTPAATMSVTAAPTDTARSTPVATREVSIVLGGDLLWHNATWASAKEDAIASGLTGADDFSFAPMFGSMVPVIQSADLAVCNQEVPLAPNGGPYLYFPTFAVPLEVAAGVAEAGYAMCTIATNHILDQGTKGIAQTVEGFGGLGVLTTGAYSSEVASRTQTIYTNPNGVRVAVVAATYGVNGQELPAGQPWAVDLINTDAMIARAQQARAAGANIVLAALHDGAEYVTAPTEQQVKNAEVLARSGMFDLVYGHNAQTVQPWTKVGDTWVAYGLGNQISQQGPDRPTSYEGITARFTFRENSPGKYGVIEATAIPTYVNPYVPGRPIRLVHVMGALGGTAPMPLGVERATLEGARDRTLAAVRSLGATGIGVG